MSKARDQLHFLIIVPALIIATTWPTFQYVLDLDTFWLPSDGTDIWLEIWESWYGGLILSGEADLFFTNRLFYPEGVSLAYHQFTLPHMIVNSLLAKLLPVSNAYNLSFLLNHFANAAAAYLLLSYIFRNKWISLFGAALVGISLIIARASPFEQSTVATIPLAIYFLQRAVDERKWRFALLCGIMVGFTAYVGSYVSVCMLLTIGMYGCYLLWSRYKTLDIWKTIAIAGIAMTIVGAPRLLPMLNNRENVEDVLDFRSSWRSNSTDLQSFIIHPALAPSESQNSYIGVVPLLLIAAGIWSSGARRKMLPWLVILLLFIVLSLGTYLTVGGVKFSQILLPQHFLNDLFPVVFRGFSRGRHWLIGALLPLTILSCYGLQSLNRSYLSHHFSKIIVVAIVILALEYYRPITGQTIDERQLSHLDWLEEEQASGYPTRLVYVPMNVTHVRWYYNFLQSLSGFPQIEGGVNRVLPEAYDYINANLLLRTWKKGKSQHCLPHNRNEYSAAVDQLIEEGLTHVVLLTRGARRAESYSFESAPSAYDDDFLSIYRVQDLADSCNNSAIRSHDHLPHLQRLALSEQIKPDPDITLLSASPSDRIDDDLFTYYSLVFNDWAGFAHLYLQDGAVKVQSAGNKGAEEFEIGSRRQLLLRLDVPDSSDPGALLALDHWLGRAYKPCYPVHESGVSVGEVWVSAEFPCELVESDNPFTVTYDSGAELVNALTTVEGGALDAAFYWINRPEGDDRLAYSIQLFDSVGSKAQQLDTVMPKHPLSHHQLDISMLDTGEYVAELVVYGFHTGASVPGIMKSSQTAFGRELELTRFAIE
ncbi:MAG: hypothetical protein OXI30_04690 [Chloroflexota bacterium]|nr:hypothetical protein [Chloroflexota bacterium]